MPVLRGKPSLAINATPRRSVRKHVRSRDQEPIAALFGKSLVVGAIGAAVAAFWPLGILVLGLALSKKRG